MFQRQEANPLIETIRNVFYNSMVDLILSIPELNSENIDDPVKLSIMQIIINSIKASRDLDIETIRIAEGPVINAKNCPNIYLEFFYSLKNIKNSTDFKKDFSLNELSFSVSAQIEQIASNLMESTSFKLMLPQLKNFIFEAKGFRQVLRPADETGITKELIRDTFYNEMVMQTSEAIDNQLIQIDALKEQEGFIYFALPGLTILEAILHSNTVNGILLLGQKVVTRENCPQDDNFPIFVDIILNAKKMMQAIYGPKIDIPAQELIVIKQLCRSNDEKLLTQPTPNASQCAAIINKLSIQISQSAMFKKMIPEVIEFCLGCLPSNVSVKV